MSLLLVRIAVFVTLILTFVCCGGGGGGGGGFNGVPAELVPNLRSEKAFNLSIGQADTGSGMQRVLRLSSQVSNYGDGPMELFGNIQNAQFGDIVPAFQIIHWNNGNTTSIPSGNFEFHQEHSHWHWENLVTFKLALGVNGTDPFDAANTVIATTNKVSFCLIDSTQLSPFPGPGQPSTPHYRFCNRNTQGISVGWADIYSSQLFGQWIVIEGVADGTYWVILEADPEGLLRETDEADNKSAVKIQITGDTVTVLP